MQSGQKKVERKTLVGVRGLSTEIRDQGTGIREQPVTSRFAVSPVPKAGDRGHTDSVHFTGCGAAPLGYCTVRLTINVSVMEPEVPVTVMV